MMRNKRTLVLSCAVILLCVCLIIGGTYALFTDSVSMTNHLIAGDLEIKLKRTLLEYNELDSNGYLVDHLTKEEVDFTDASDKNVFGLENSGEKDSKILMVPGSYFKATMQLISESDVAFDYTIQLKVSDLGSEAENQKFASRLYVKVYEYDAEKAVFNEEASIEAPLSAFLKDSSNTDTTTVKTLTATGSTQFVVFLEFMNDEDNVDDNPAMNGKVSFDLIVNAVQRLTPAAQ